MDVNQQLAMQAQQAGRQPIQAASNQAPDTQIPNNNVAGGIANVIKALLQRKQRQNAAAGQQPLQAASNQTPNYGMNPGPVVPGNNMGPTSIGGPQGHTPLNPGPAVGVAPPIPVPASRPPAAGPGANALPVAPGGPSALPPAPMAANDPKWSTGVPTPGVFGGTPPSAVPAGVGSAPPPTPMPTPPTPTPQSGDAMAGLMGPVPGLMDMPSNRVANVDPGLADMGFGGGPAWS